MKRRGGVMPSNISYEKKGWCRALMHVVHTAHAGDKTLLSIYFLRKEGVVSCPHACCSYNSCRRQEFVLKLFPTKRRGGVVPSCMLFLRHMQKTRVCTQDISYEKKGWCRALMHVVNTHAGDKSRRVLNLNSLQLLG